MDDQAMLTTIDNPYSPFTEYDSWYQYDSTSGYHTPEYLARIVLTSDDMSDADQRVAINQAIDEIVNENVLGIYLKVTQVDSNN